MASSEKRKINHIVIHFRIDKGGPPKQGYTSKLTATSPLHLSIPCSSRLCSGGGFDLRRKIYPAIDEGAESIEDVITCSGTEYDGQRKCLDQCKFYAEIFYA